MRRDSPVRTVVAMLSGRGAPSPELGLGFRAAIAALFALLVVLIVLFWPSSGVFVYEGF